MKVGCLQKPNLPELLPIIIFKRMYFRIFLQHTELVCAFMGCGNITLNDGELSVNGEEAICPLFSLFLPPFFFPVHCRDGFWCWQQTVCKAAEGQAPHMFSVASGSAKLGFIPTSMQFICSYCQKPLLYVWVVIHLNNSIKIYLGNDTPSLMVKTWC